MKKFVCLVLILSTITMVLTSCEKRCVCEYDESGIEEIMYNAYSKKECNEWEDYYSNDLNIKVTCTYKRFK